MTHRGSWTNLQRNVAKIIHEWGLTMQVFTWPKGKYSKVYLGARVILDRAYDAELVSFVEGIRFAKSNIDVTR